MPIPDPEDQVQFLAAVDHLERWQERNTSDPWTAALAEHPISADLELTRRVAAWAYGQAERTSATVWSQGRDGMVPLDERWRAILSS